MSSHDFDGITRIQAEVRAKSRFTLWLKEGDRAEHVIEVDCEPCLYPVIALLVRAINSAARSADAPSKPAVRALPQRFTPPSPSYVPPLTTCEKCGKTAIAFICDTPGCPVNGGAAYPWTDPRPSAAASSDSRLIPLARLDAIQGDDDTPPEAA